MSLQSVLVSALQVIGADTGRVKWLPDQPIAEDGKSYAPYLKDGAWSWSEVPPGSPPLDLFVSGWSTYGINKIVDVLNTGTVHAAVSAGPEQPLIGTVQFERSDTRTIDGNVPTGGWSGTNWELRRAAQAPVPPTIGNNTARLETTAFPDFPEPTFGEIANVADLCKSSIQRNTYWTVSNLTVGRRYYVGFIFATYPDALRRGTRIQPSDGGEQIVFGVDGISSIANSAIKRYGFTATSTDISFLKSGDDNNGSYCNGMFAIDQGVA